jgi:ubiquinone/menaquinone biosynthesis C-methylase UbiE
MAHETVDANRVALDLLELGTRDRVLEVGFGHGATLAKAAAIVTDGVLAGIDHSPVMLRIARRRNAAALKCGRMALALADSRRIPYPDDSFDKVYGVHTVYVWPKAEPHLGELFGVMAPGGRLILGYQPREDARFVAQFSASAYLFRSVEEVERAVAGCGFRPVRSETRKAAGGIMAWTVAEKPRPG